jgi:hypothetical protein
MEGCLKFFVGAVVAIVLLRLLAYLLVNHWQFIVIPAALAVAIFIVAMLVKTRRDETTARHWRERHEKEQEEARKQKLREEQLRYRKEMIWISQQTIDVFEIMPQLLIEAEQFLDQAEIDYKETAFSPFWDAIEKAASKLGRFDEALRRINGNSLRYAELIKLYAGKPQSYPVTGLSVSKLDTGKGTVLRLKSIVRKAQRDRDFASIYEQRKTNQILVAGFTNLAQALDQMSSQITTSVDNLSNSVDALSATMEESTRTINARMSEIRDAVTDLHEDISEHQSEQAWREKKAAEMLDNIQRGRKPLVDPSPII